MPWRDPGPAPVSDSESLNRVKTVLIAAANYSYASQSESLPFTFSRRVKSVEIQNTVIINDFPLYFK